MLSKLRSLFRSLQPGSTELEELRRRALGDQALVERLVDFEARRAPGISRDEAIRRANSRWTRDAR